MRKLGITESYKLKRQVVTSASEAAEMIIRYVCKPCTAGLLLMFIDQSESTTSCVQHREDGKANRREAIPSLRCINNAFRDFSNPLGPKFSYQCSG